MKLNLIVNADDFGFSEKTNRAVAEAFKKNYVTNTTLMVNMPFADDAVKIAKSEGFFDRVGMHLNLTEGVPINTNLLKYTQFTQGGGGTTLSSDFLRTRARFFITDGNLNREIRREIELQIQKFLSYNPSLLHIDSHHHSHTAPSIWKHCREIFKKYGIKTTRLSRNLCDPESLSLYKRVYKYIFNRDVKKLNLAGKVNLFGHFISLQSLLDFDKHKVIHDNDVIEIMCHPAYKDGQLIDRTDGKFFQDFSQCYSACTLTKF